MMVPTFKPLYWILVLPASSPSADWKTIVILGPWLMILVTATQVPATAATIGMIQTSESRVRFLGTTFASGTWGSGLSLSGMLNLLRTCGIPDQSRIKGLDREHRQHHHRGEEKKPGRRLHRHERLKLDEGDGEGVDKHVH